MNERRSNILLQSGELVPTSRPIVYGQSLFVVGAFFWIPALVVYIQKRLKTTRDRALSVLGLILVLLIPVKRSSFVQDLFVWDAYARYFSTKVVGVPFDKVKQTVFGIYPHGIVPLTLGFTAFGELNKLFNRLRIVVASATRMVPVFTHVLRWGGAVDASRSSVEATLQAGESIGVNPGGIAEMFWTYPQPGCLPDEEYAVVRSRKGFVRLAVKYGANLVPVFVFGGSKLFRLLPVPKFLETISRRLKTSLLLFYGRFGLPIPFRVPMLYAVGATIQTIAQTNPSPEEVDFVHNIFMRELERTFEAHKDQYGWSHKKLVLV